MVAERTFGIVLGQRLEYFRYDKHLQNIKIEDKLERNQILP